jgi:hypothetical protein
VHVYQDKTAELEDWIRDEVELERELTQGDTGPAVGRVVEYAGAHLAAHPREVGGENRGP